MRGGGGGGGGEPSLLVAPLSNTTIGPGTGLLLVEGMLATAIKYKQINLCQTLI